MGKNKRRNKLLSLFLTAFFLSAAAGTFTACSGETETTEVDQSEISSSQTADNSRIKNGGFESDTEKASAPIVTSPKSWSKSSQVSSKTASGIIDTKAEAWDSLTKTGNVSPANETEAAEKWADMNAYDRLQYIKNWKEANSGKDVDDLEFYTDQYNISADDIPDADVNPGTHYAENEAGADKNTKVLMIHNAVSSTSSIGAAQYYTSSSTVTLAPGTAAKFSVWVKTAKLTYGSDFEADQGRGAYIAVSQTVGGKSKEQVQVKNINTENVNPSGENNGWVKYEFYVKGSNYASSTFTLVLGLGQGTSSNQFGCVNGYAFFDDIECSVIKASEYDSFTSGATDIKQATDTEYEFDTYDECKDVFKYAINLSSALSAATFADLGITDACVQKIDAKNNKFDGETASDKTGIFTKSALDAGIGTESNEYFKTVWQSDFATFPFNDSNELLVLFSASKTAYEAKSTTNLSVPANSSRLYSVWVKTSKIVSGNTGAGISITEKANASDTDGDVSPLLSSLDSTTGAKTDVDGSAGAKEENIFAGWQQCTLLIENNTDVEKYFSFTFTFGATSEEAEKSAYGAGYAAFTQPQTMNLTSKEAEFFSTGTYAAEYSFNEDDKDAGAAAFDTRAADEDKNKIETEFARLSSYNGVNGGSSWVNKNNQDKELNKVDTYEFAGLVNKSYASAYAATYAAETALADYFANPASLFGDVEEPLMIYNKEANKSYGYIAKSSTSISADSYKTISVKIKTSPGAKASVYLIDSDVADKTAFVFNTPKVAYWYDKTGNVCAKDPTESSFKRDTDTAFFLDKRGLYVANTSWTGYDEATMKDKVFANLSAYGKDAYGNLVVADGGVSYNYDSTVWNNQGVDGVAYYYEDGTYYAYSDDTVPVTDLLTLVTAGKLTPRSLTTDSQGEIALSAENVDTNGEWITYTFYLHTGNEAKNYRLEVWSGVRNGESGNAAESYVMFAADKRADLTSDTWSSNVNETVKKAKGTLSEEEFKKSENVRYYAFSFLDSAKYLRYDSTLDKEEVGNSYTSYDSTSADYAEGVAYLKYTEDNGDCRVYVDYSRTEVSVTEDTEDDSSTDTDDTSSETGGMNVWLLASSILLAAILLLAIVSIAIRRIVKKKGRKVKAPKQSKSKK